MKKIVLFSLLLASCAGTKTSNFNVLENEPKNCEFLYTLNTSAVMYDRDDAKKYLEQTLTDQEKIGDSYWIVDSQVLENHGAIFGPKNTYKFKVKVYDCKR